MKTPPIPSNEKERLSALKEYQILDTLPEQAYDDITKIASHICGTPIALVSLIDEDRQWFKSHHGLGVSETPKNLAYCAHAINEPDKIMEVPDAFKDERFHDNPLATGDPHVVFYAGAPLTDDEGHTLGTLCVIDHEERHLSDEQKDVLWALSRQVVALLQLRKENLKRKQIDKDFNTLVENLGDGVFELDENGKCTYANNKMLELLGRNLSKVINTSIWDMIYAEDVTEMKAFYGKQFKKKSEKCRYEYRLQPVNGDPIWVSQNTTMEYEGNRMIKLRSISRDISDAKAMEEELILKESQYKLVSENSTDLIALHELDGTYKFVSPSSKDILGFTPDELVGRNPYEIIHPDDIDLLKQGPHQKTIEGDSIRNVEYRLKRKDETYVWMQSYTNPIQSDQGEVIAFQTSSRNISYRKQEEQKIQKHLEGLTLLNELAAMPSSNKSILSEAIQRVTKHLGMDAGIIGQIKDDNFLVINQFSASKKIDSLTKLAVRETCASISYNRDEPLLIDEANDTQILNHPCFPNESVHSYLSSCIYKSGKKFGLIELLNFNKNEEEFSSYNKEFLQLFANWIGSVLESQEENELLKRARKHAEAASEAKASFLSMMSHEIRTPLNGIIGTTHLLLSKSPSDVQLPHLKVLEQSSNNLMSIVNDILDFGKIEEGKIQMDRSAFDLKELTSSIFNNYKTQGDEKGISVSYSYDESLSEFYIGDSVRISQILHNLLSNAVKFTHEGQVLIRLEKSNSHDNFDEIQFSVRDSGVGIPKEKQKDIFEVFIQADETTTRKFGGSGLGLAITKNLIELMNSEIQVESHEGFGSLFKFKLIMPRATKESVISNSQVNENFEQLKASILLVEDNLFNRAIAKDFLESWGCNVQEAGDGKEALNLLNKDAFDLVLLDLQMPVMDGYETINAIRSHPIKKIADLPVIALTAAAMGDIEDKVYQSGMDDFITKPFHPVDFYQKLTSFFSESGKYTDYEDIETRILDKLQKTLGPDEKQITRYFAIFVKTLEEENKVLKASIRGENFPALKAYAHKNKSSLLLGGLSDLAKEAEELEEMLGRKAPQSRILEKAINHQNKIDNILQELHRNE